MKNTLLVIVALLVGGCAATPIPLSPEEKKVAGTYEHKVNEFTIKYVFSNRRINDLFSRNVVRRYTTYKNNTTTAKTFNWHIKDGGIRPSSKGEWDIHIFRIEPNGDLKQNSQFERSPLKKIKQLLLSSTPTVPPNSPEKH